MEALHNILVLMEPGSESQPAFDAALMLGQRFGARLELLMSDYQDLHAAYFSPPSATVQEFHDAVMSAHRAVLEKYVQPAEAAGVPAICEALWGTPFHEVVLARVKATQPDLVVNHSVYHSRIERTLFTGSDWRLIRECPVPLLLVKAAERLVDARILVWWTRCMRTTSRPRSTTGCCERRHMVATRASSFRSRNRSSRSRRRA